MVVQGKTAMQESPIRVCSFYFVTGCKLWQTFLQLEIMNLVVVFSQSWLWNCFERFQWDALDSIIIHMRPTQNCGILFVFLRPTIQFHQFPDEKITRGRSFTKQGVWQLCQCKKCSFLICSYRFCSIVPLHLVPVKLFVRLNWKSKVWVK